jgi:hypothetical protein
MAEAKTKKPPANKFGPSTAEEVTAGLASMSFGVSSATEIGRRALAAKASKAKTPKEAPTLAEINARLSQAEAELQASTANVAPRKSAGRPKKAVSSAGGKLKEGLECAIAYARGDESVVVVHQVQESRSAEKHGAKTAEIVEIPQLEGANPPNRGILAELRRTVAALSPKSGDEFKSALKRLGVRQHEFASLTNTPVKTVEKWAANGAPPVVCKLLDMWAMSPDEVRSMLEALL